MLLGRVGWEEDDRRPRKFRKRRAVLRSFEKHHPKEERNCRATQAISVVHSSFAFGVTLLCVSPQNRKRSLS